MKRPIPGARRFKAAAVIAASEFELSMPLPMIRRCNEIYSEVEAPGGQQ